MIDVAKLLGLNVLNVDDCAINQRVISDMLAICSIPVTSASSGAEALDMLSVETFDLVLMDIHMPGLNGLETLRAIRGCCNLNRQVRIVALTGDVHASESEFKAMGFDGFLSKPISMRPLLNAVLECLRSEDAPLRLQPHGARR